MRVVQTFLSLDSLKLIYSSYFHSILTYGIIFWGNTPHRNVTFRMQKTTVRIVVLVRNRDFCREYCKSLKIFPIQSQYLLLLLLFVAENVDHFRLNSEIRGFKIKNKSIYVYRLQNWQFTRGDLNKLPTYVKNLLQTRKKFKRALKEFLHFHSFYSLNEFYNYNRL